METIDSDNNRGSATAYVTNTDIQLMNDNWFTISSRPDTSDSSCNETETETETETFTTMKSPTSLINEKGTPYNNYGKMPNDFLIKIYFTSLGLLGLYFFLKIMLRKRLRS
jgi:hypothetical protein